MEGVSVSASGDSSTKSMKSNLKGWREIFVMCSKLLKWEQPYYPFIIIGLVSVLFLFVWYLDPSLITGASVGLLILCICDYLIPFVSPMIFPEAHWNSSKEKEFSDACRALSDFRGAIRKSFSNIFQLKNTNPLLYVAVSTISLCFTAWLGNQMHNLMLLYFTVLIVAALPGLAHHGLLQRGASAVGKFGKKHKN